MSSFRKRQADGSELFSAIKTRRLQERASGRDEQTTVVPSDKGAGDTLSFGLFPNIVRKTSTLHMPVEQSESVLRDLMIKAERRKADRISLRDTRQTRRSEDMDNATSFTADDLQLSPDTDDSQLPPTKPHSHRPPVDTLARSTFFSAVTTKRIVTPPEAFALGPFEKETNRSKSSQNDNDCNYKL